MNAIKTDTKVRIEKQSRRIRSYTFLASDFRSRNAD